MAAMEIRDRVIELRRVRAKHLVPNPKNWRRHPKAQANALRGLLGEIGNSDALLVRELPDGRLQLIDGHLRAGIMPDEEVPVLILDLNEAEADKLLLTLDPLASMAVADSERLDALLESVRTDDPAIQALLDDLRAQEGLLPENLNDLADPEPQVDKAKELRCKWESGQKFRMVWCDPPYGVDYAGKNELLNRTDRGNRIQKAIANDELAPQAVTALFRDALKQALAFAAKGASCYATVPSGTLLPHFIAAFSDSGFSFKHLLVWVKQHFVIGMSDYQQRHEPVLYGWREDGPHFFIPDRCQSSVFEVDKPHASVLHPTTKPVALMARMIANSSRPSEIVYDPFCGSGSTIVAAAQLKRVGYGCELDPGYLAVELERLASLGLKPELRRKP
jgi:DNA modification methylase